MNSRRHAYATFAVGHGVVDLLEQRGPVADTVDDRELPQRPRAVERRCREGDRRSNSVRSVPGAGSAMWRTW